VADRLGVTPSAVSRWVSGEWRIPEARVVQLAALLGVEEFRIRNEIPREQQNASPDAPTSTRNGAGVKDGCTDAGSQDSHRRASSKLSNSQGAA
jgi:transcriptional regulator with XRE-family HTH domain